MRKFLIIIAFILVIGQLINYFLYSAKSIGTLLGIVSLLFVVLALYFSTENEGKV